MLRIGTKVIRSVYKGNLKFSKIYRGSTLIFPGLEWVNVGTDYDASWTYPTINTRKKNAYPWTQNVFQDESIGPKVYGTTYQITENGLKTVEDSGLYWNGACGSNYYYVDYKKVRDKYTFNDGYVTYGSYYNGTSRSRRIDGSCGWVRGWTTWANTGYTCDALGNKGSYSCSGTTTVKYYHQERYYQYPDGSGRTQTDQRAGSLYSQENIEGYCGYSSYPVRSEIPYYGYSEYETFDCYYSGYPSFQQMGSLWIDIWTMEVFTHPTAMDYAQYGLYLVTVGPDVYSSEFYQV